MIHFHEVWTFGSMHEALVTTCILFHFCQYNSPPEYRKKHSWSTLWLAIKVKAYMYNAFVKADWFQIKPGVRCTLSWFFWRHAHIKYSAFSWYCCSTGCFSLTLPRMRNWSQMIYNVSCKILSKLIELKSCRSYPLIFLSLSYAFHVSGWQWQILLDWIQGIIWNFRS